MSQKPLTMEQLKQVLQLKKDGVAIREIVRRTGISRNAVKRYLSRLQPLPGDQAEDLSNKQLADKAYDNDTLLYATGRQEALMKHFIYGEKELYKTGVNRQLLWLEYKEQHPDGYTYSRYCYHFNIFLKHTDVSMHLEYEAGDMIMIDFAGKKLGYVHPDIGEMVEAQVLYWLAAELPKTIARTLIYKAIAYVLNHFEALIKYTTDGMLLIDNNQLEGQIRAIAVGRMNYLFAGSHRGGELAAIIYSLMATCKLQNIDPANWLEDVLRRIPVQSEDKLIELLPQFWKPLSKVKKVTP